jgi:hypothetical protein
VKDWFRNKIQNFYREGFVKRVSRWRKFVILRKTVVLLNTQGTLRCDVLTEVLYALTPRSSEKARLFGGTHRLHLQGRIVKPRKKPAEEGGNQSLY